MQPVRTARRLRVDAGAMVLAERHQSASIRILDQSPITDIHYHAAFMI
jgi:hypothetical protein